MKISGRAGFFIGILAAGFVVSGSSSVRSPERAASEDVIVAAHYAPWFKGTAEPGWTQWVGTKKVHTAYTPFFGFYDNRTPATLSKHVEWAAAVRFRVAQIPNQSIEVFLNGKKLGSFSVQTPEQWTLLESKLK